MLKNKRGITLVALVVTIILLLILAGVSINMIFGENGIFSKTEIAVNKYDKEEATEVINLKKLSIQAKCISEEHKVADLQYIADELCEDDEVEYVKQGKLIAKLEKIDVTGYSSILVKLKAYVHEFEIGQDMQVAVIGGDEEEVVSGSGRGEQVTTMKKFGNTQVPIPGGFYYVGGNLDTGIVISDNKDDENKGDSFEVALNLKGNQFVWIPCKVTDDANNEYKRENTLWNSYRENEPADVADEISPRVTNEKTAVAKYGGFYVARYEAGLAPTISRYESGRQVWDSVIYNKYGLPVSKAKQIPWNFVDYYHAFTSSIMMYSKNKEVESWLISGTQWDVMLKVIESKGKVSGTDNSPSLTDSGAWGNYNNQTLTYTGRVAQSNSNSVNAFPEDETTGEKKANVWGYWYLLTTGSSETTKVYNIFDVAGNLWEWTVEADLYSPNDSRIYRGGSFYDESGGHPASSRKSGLFQYRSTGWGSGDLGFRVVLYVL